MVDESQAFSYIPIIDNDIDKSLQDQCKDFGLDIANMEEVKKRMRILFKTGSVTWEIDDKPVLAITRGGCSDEIVYRIKKLSTSKLILLRAN
jgi:hypothetical protein